MAKFDFKNMDLGLDSINPENLGLKTITKTIDIKMIDDNKQNDAIYQSKQEEDDLLLEDIERNGLLNPITIIKSDTFAGRYTVIAGHRRLRACKKLKMAEVDCKEIVATTEEQKLNAKILLVTSNVTQRERSPLERMNEVEYLTEIAKQKNVGNVVEWISKIIDMSQRMIYRYQKLAKMDEEVQKSVESGEMGITQAIKETPKKEKVAKEFDVNKASNRIYKIASDLKENTTATMAVDEKTRRNILNTIDLLEKLL